MQVKALVVACLLPGGCDGSYLGVHLLLAELSDSLNGFGGSLLELDILDSLVQVKRVISAGWLHLGLLSHLLKYVCIY